MLALPALLALPPVLVVGILQHLTLADAARVRAVCRALRDAVDSTHYQLWATRSFLQAQTALDVPLEKPKRGEFCTRVWATHLGVVYCTLTDYIRITSDGAMHRGSRTITAGPGPALRVRPDAIRMLYESAGLGTLLTPDQEFTFGGRRFNTVVQRKDSVVMVCAGNVRHLVCTPAGDWLAAFLDTGAVQLLHPATERVLAPVPHDLGYAILDGPPTSLAPDRSCVAGHGWLLPLRGRHRGTARKEPGVCMAFTPDARVMRIDFENNRVSVSRRFTRGPPCRRATPPAPRGTLARTPAARPATPAR